MHSCNSEFQLERLGEETVLVDRRGEGREQLRHPATLGD
jgi:hypothetical protein